MFFYFITAELLTKSALGWNTQKELENNLKLIRRKTINNTEKNLLKEKYTNKNLFLFPKF